MRASRAHASKQRETENFTHPMIDYANFENILGKKIIFLKIYIRAHRDVFLIIFLLKNCDGFCNKVTVKLP